MTLFEKIQAAGIPWDSHASDLYVKATPESARIIKEHGPSHVTAFRDELTGETWFDVAFMYAPFWETTIRTGGRIPITLDEEKGTVLG